MSAQRKQYADLIRHRELNALRRLMVGRHVPTGTLRTTLPGAGRSTRGVEQTVLRIDELESQMNQIMLNRVVTTQGLAPYADTSDVAAVATSRPEFKPTQVVLSQPAHLGAALEAAEQAVIVQAAALFAANQQSGAQQCLTTAIGANGAQHDHVPTWLVLFDFYRATDQPQPFEALALDFSVRFGRSPPAWLSIPSLLPTTKAPFIQAQSPSDWGAPTALDSNALTGLLLNLSHDLAAKRALVLDWRALISVEPTAWSDLKLFFTLLAEQTIHCKMYGLSSLESTFTNALADSMLARLALLRCLNQQEAFEDLALEYCTAFEVSPPDWRQGLCQLTVQNVSMISSSAVREEPIKSAAWELLGELTALPEHFLATALSVTAAPPERLVVRCDRLVRCAPPATVALRLWVQTMKERGTLVILQDVHRVVATYWLSQGIYEHAKVVIRKD